MTKAPSPLLGYNNNVRHKNRVFHVQTEDSGIKHPHIITHLFMDGGRILKSVKTSYAEHIGTEKMADTVRQMMKEQHKAMFIALRDGQYDHLVEDQSKAAAPAQAKRKSEAPKAASPNPPAAAPAVVKKSVPPPSVTAKTEESPPTKSPELTLDIDALERAAKDAETASPMFQRNSDLPPPPSNMFRDKPNTGTYRALTPTPPKPPSKPPPRAKSSRPPPVSRQNPQPAPRISNAYNQAVRGPNSRPSSAGNPRVSPQNEARYAPARPAAIFGKSRPQSTGSIFGEDLISDKSLDEVILSYLAEDLEGDAKKKK